MQCKYSTQRQHSFLWFFAQFYDIRAKNVCSRDLCLISSLSSVRKSKEHEVKSTVRCRYYTRDSKSGTRVNHLLQYFIQTLKIHTFITDGVHNCFQFQPAESTKNFTNQLSWLRNFNDGKGTEGSTLLPTGHGTHMKTTELVGGLLSITTSTTHNARSRLLF